MMEKVPSIVKGGDRKLVSCAECQTPVAEVQDDVLIIRSRHHGDRHFTVISLRLLDKGEKTLQK